MCWGGSGALGAGQTVSQAAGNPLRKDGGDHFTDVYRFFDTRPEHVEPLPNSTRLLIRYWCVSSDSPSTGGPTGKNQCQAVKEGGGATCAPNICFPVKHFRPGVCLL